MATLIRGIYDIVYNPQEALGLTDATYAASTVSATGDNTIIAAPGANKRLIIDFLQLQNESAVATIIQVKWADVARWQVLLQSQSQIAQTIIKPGWSLPTNTAFILNLSGANTIGYSIAYVIQDV